MTPPPDMPTGRLRTAAPRLLRAFLAVAALAVVAAASAGCQRALFADEGGRTQFDDYNLIRQRYVPVEEPDVFGNPQPALRARLTQVR
jgi:hypothetical protein